MDDIKPLTLLSYTSIASHEMSHEELIGLLQKARTNNLKRNVTGLLLYMDNCFFQVLEGEQSVVEDLFALISKDSRHHHVMKLIEEPIEERSFGDWNMGYQHVTRAELANFTGLTDFLDHDGGFDCMVGHRARTLIDAFRMGRWQRLDTKQYRVVGYG